jgi:alpha-L-fucosidase 2
MEWSHEIPELEKSGHRHTSPLFSLYPGRDISVTLTPELAKAAVSLMGLEGHDKVLPDGFPRHPGCGYFMK